MRRVKITILAALLAVCWAGLRPAIANDLDGVSVTRQGDSIAVTITTSAGCEYNAFLTDSKPERIVIDLSGVVNNLPKKQFANLPLKSIKSIRTSQFKSEPELQARVVLDIHRPIEFTSFRAINEVVVKFAAVPDELASVDWASSNSNKAATFTETSVEPEKPAIEKPVEVAEIEPKAETKAETRPVEKPVEVAQNPPEPVEKPQAAPVQVAETTPVAQAEDEPDVPAQPVVTPMAAPAAQGIQVDTSPKRKTVEYTANDEKDPFLSLIGQSTGNMVDGLPSLENLKLVGILEDNRTSSALLEDSEGNGYILKPNDRIQSGYLVNVTDTKAVFQITEYGWTRTVALELQVPDIK